MRKFLLIICLLVTLKSYAQTDSSILLEKIGISEQSELITDRIFEIYKDLSPNVPKEIWTEIRGVIDTRVYSRDVEEAITNYYTTEELNKMTNSDVTLETLKPMFLNDLKLLAENYGKYVALTVKDSLSKKGY